MKRGGLVLINLFLILLFAFILIPKTSISGFSVLSSGRITDGNLDELRVGARVECLKNSQCLDGFECIENNCIDDGLVYIKNVKLSGGARNLNIGDKINSIKSILTKADLPYVLSSGELVKIKGRVIEYFYSQSILIGDYEMTFNGLEVLENKPVFTYRLMFSNPIDFSDEDFHGQVLKILGKEYIIDGKSDNSEIVLVFDDKKIKIRNNKRFNLGKTFLEENQMKIDYNDNGLVNGIIIEFFKNIGEIKDSENFKDNVFGSIKLNKKFNDVEIEIVK